MSGTTVTASGKAQAQAVTSAKGAQPKGRSDAGRTNEEANVYRVVVFGAAGVGKTSLIHRFTKNEFREAYVPTIEDTYRTVISNDRNLCTLEITDTAGSHQFPAMQRLSIQKGNAFIMVYSITSKPTLEELKHIMMNIKQIKGTNYQATPILLVGNKSDDSGDRTVSAKLGEEVGKTWGCKFIETSAKTNDNVREMFAKLLDSDTTRRLSLQSPLEAGKDDKKDKKTKKEKVPKDKTDKKEKEKTEKADKSAKKDTAATEEAPKKKCSLQ